MRYWHVGRLLFLLAVVLQTTWYALLMTAYVRMPGKLEGADFLTYYSVGRVAAEYGLARVYDLDLAAVAQAETAGVPLGTQQVLPPNHPPFLYPFLALLGRLPYRLAYFGYALLLYGLAVASLPVLIRTLKQSGWSPEYIGMIVVSVLLFEPFFMSVLKGQDSALLLLGGLLWLSGWRSGDDRLAGLGLSLTLIRPQIALPLALPFLFRQRGVFGWFLIGAIGLGLYSFLQVGWKGALDYLHILTISAGGEGYGMEEMAMFNLLGLVRRLAPEAKPMTIRSLAWGFYALALISLCALWAISKQVRLWHLALAVNLTLLAVPHLHYHDLTLLLVPLLGVGMVGGLASRQRVRTAAALPMVVSLLLLFGELWDPTRYTVPYLLMAILPVLVWRHESNERD
ncbi:MAG: DUF2029 domain-containing protein [Anaerolineales bacterium]|nr:DUF2029 domain-containing protein [Anaerolineales bacterium]MCX7608567.1 DUF2029 domain-containing protein [Anaerolineales bacterium]